MVTSTPCPPLIFPSPLFIFPNKSSTVPPIAANAILCEDGQELLAEDGQTLLTES